MPIYEYVCPKCRHKFSVLARAPKGDAPPACPRCRCAETSRVFSVFSVRGKTDRDVYEDILTDRQLTSGLLAGDPRALAAWNKKMTGGTDEETAPEYGEMLERMENGEMPSPETIQALKGAEAGDDGEP